MQERRKCRRTRVGVITFLAPEFPLADPHVEVFRKEIDTCLERGEIKVIVDFKGVPFIDSVGLEALLDAHEYLQKKGGMLRIANPNHVCNDIFTATRIAEQLGIFPEIEVAGRNVG